MAMDGYSSWIKARCERAAEINKGVRRKTKSDYDEALERMLKLLEADRKNIALINSLFGGYETLNLLLESENMGDLTIDEKIALRATLLRELSDENESELFETQGIENGSQAGVTYESVANIFNSDGIVTQTPEGTRAIIKPIEGEYEILEGEDGEVILKLKSGGSGAVYDENGTIGSLANIYGTSNGVELTGSMVIDGKEVEVRVIADKTDWNEEFRKLGSKAADTIGATLASGANLVIGLGKGLAGGLEYLTDGYLVGKAQMDKSLATGIGALVEAMGIEDGAEAASEVKAFVEGSTKAIITEEIVENVYTDFMDENAIGQTINENAYGLLKKDGIVTKMAVGLGKITAIGSFSTLTGVPAWMIAGIEATGEYTSSALNRLENDGKTRSLPNDFDSAVAYGATNALWEMIQWGSGIGLNKLGSKGMAPTVRVGVDTLFNAADTPFRSVVASETFGTSYSEEFESQGGLAGVAADVGIGLLGSIGGEIIDELKNGKARATEQINKYVEECMKAQKALDANDTRILKLKTQLTKDIENGTLKLRGKKLT